MELTFSLRRDSPLNPLYCNEFDALVSLEGKNLTFPAVKKQQLYYLLSPENPFPYLSAPGSLFPPIGLNWSADLCWEDLSPAQVACVFLSISDVTLMPVRFPHDWQ